MGSSKEMTIIICKQVLVVFARGSGQNSADSYDASDPALRELYMQAGVNASEKQTATFFKEFSNSIGTGKSVQYVSLHNFSGKYNNYGYAAVGATNAAFDTHKPQHRKDVSNRFYESVKDGSEELAWYLEDQMTSCPLQRVVLGGYSQGAETVADGINLLQPAFRARIAYMALYGDPKFNPAQSLLPPIAGDWKRGSTDIFTHGVLDQRKDYIPSGIVNAGSWCQAGDMICDAGQLDGNEINNILYGKLNQTSAHSDSYQSVWIPKSMPEIITALRNVLPNITNGASTNVFINKNDKLWQLDLAVVIDLDQSMSKSLQTIEGNVGGLTGELLGSYWDSRVAVVSYDTPHLPSAYAQVESDFTNDHTQTSNALRNLQANPIAASQDQHQLYSGLMTAMNQLDWRHGAQKKIIVITNAGPAKPSAEGYTQNQVQERAFNLDPAVINLANVSCDDDAGTCDWDAYNDLQPLADATNGTNMMVDISSGDMGGFESVLGGMELQPVAGISGDTSGYVDTPLNLSADSSYDPDAAIAEYDWDCDGDGTWDSTGSNPNATCTYSTPYDGLVTLRVVSDGGTGAALATLPVHIIPGTPPTAIPPMKPIASLLYTPSGVHVSWLNTYGSDTSIRIADADDNLLGYSPASATDVTLSGIGSEVSELHISACATTSNCSEPSILPLDASKLEQIVTPDDAESFIVHTAAGSLSAATTVDTPRTAANLAAQVQTTTIHFASAGALLDTPSVFSSPTNHGTTSPHSSKRNVAKQFHAILLAIPLAALALSFAVYRLRRRV